MSDTIEPDIPELADLPGEAKPPAHLERRVVAALRREELLAGSGRARRGSRWFWLPAAAAAVLLLAAGWWLGGRQGLGPGVESATHVLLLREDDAYSTAPAGHEMERVAEYVAWAREKRGAGQVVAGMKLGEESAMLIDPRRPDGRIPGLSRPDRVAGLFLIRSRDMEEARSLAESCPHLRHGGIIEIRPIEGG